MLALCTLKVKMTVNFCVAASGALQIKGLEGSFMIEWVDGSLKSAPPLSGRRARPPAAAAAPAATSRQPDRFEPILEEGAI